MRRGTSALAVCSHHLGIKLSVKWRKRKAVTTNKGTLTNVQPWAKFEMLINDLHTVLER